VDARLDHTDLTEAISALLTEAEAAHGVYETTVLGGVYDEAWAEWYATYAVEHGIGKLVGRPVTANRLSRLLATMFDEFKRADPRPTEQWAAWMAPRIAAELSTNAGNGAYVLRPGEGRSIDLGGFEMSVKATAEQTNGSFSLLEAAEPAGFGPPLHIHRDAAEAFYVLEGEYVIFLDGREFVCPAGSFTFIPAGLPHGFRVGSVASRKLNLYAPAAMVGYFDDVAGATQAGDVDPDQLSEIALRYSMEVIGPVPEGYV
jgi:mannose-6-phosphate isomerase-like protein (cupin superfamily)